MIDIIPFYDHVDQSPRNHIAVFIKSWSTAQI